MNKETDLKLSKKHRIKKSLCSACFLLGSFGIDMVIAANSSEPNTTGIEQSYLAESEGDYSTAAKAMKSILNTDAYSNEFANLRFAWLRYLQKDYNSAIKFYKKALQLNPDSIDAKLGIALVMQAQLRWKEAGSYASQVLATAPANYIAHLRLMISYAAQKKWSKLKTQAQNMVKLYPTQAAPFVYLARSQVYRGNKKQAVENYKAVLLRTPGNLEAKNYLAAIK